MTALRTTTTCRDCGNQIPESLLDDALCVVCRYPAKKKKADENDAVPTEYEIAADKFAFDVFADASEPPPAGDGLDLEPVLAFLIADDAPAQAIGERVLALAYLMPLVHGRPANARELGARLGCSHVAALKKVTKLKAAFAGDLREITETSYQAKQW
jgi:hypothetical protein